jgi:hypothetical protein
LALIGTGWLWHCFDVDAVRQRNSLPKGAELAPDRIRVNGLVPGASRSSPAFSGQIRRRCAPNSSPRYRSGALLNRPMKPPPPRCLCPRRKPCFSQASRSKLTVAGRYNPHESACCGLFGRLSTTDGPNHRSPRDSFAMDCLGCGQTQPGDRHDWYLASPRGKMGHSACQRGIFGD